jgi:hypothetical protein
VAGTGIDRTRPPSAPVAAGPEPAREPSSSNHGRRFAARAGARPSWLPLLLLLLTFLPAVSAPAAAIQAVAVGEAAVTVGSESATPAFPNGIDFAVAASSPEGIAEAELFWRPALEETLTLELPEVTPGDSVAVEHRVDLRAGALPPGLDVHYVWRFTEPDGDTFETPERTVLWEDGRFDWRPLSEGLVTVYAYAGDEAFQAEVLASAVQTVAELSRRFDAELTDPIRIWVYASADDFAGSLAPNSEPWIVGAAYPWFGLVNAVLPTGDRDELARVVPHEISHLVLYQATRNPFNGPPAWLDEGLATLAQGSGQAPLWARVARAAEAGELDRLRSLNGQFPYDAEDALLAYAQSLSVVQYIIDTYGETGLSNLIAVFREGVSYDEAVERALGLSLDELDEAWRTAVPAQAERQLAALGGTTGRDSGRSAFDAVLLASGSLIMGVVAVVALVVGIRAFLRLRRLEPEPEGPPNGRVVDSRALSDPIQEQRA